MNTTNATTARNESTTTVKVYSAGYNHGNSASIQVNSQDLGSEIYSRGLNVAVFDQVTGQPILGTNFDTFYSENSETFVQFIETLPSGRIVAIATKDDASLNLSNPGKKACESLGSRLINDLEFRSSWAMIGQKGAAPGTATEQLSNESAVTCLRQITQTTASLANFVITATSSGSNWGNITEVTCNRKQISFPGGYQRGLNVVVFDPANGNQLKRQSFDFYADPANADRFADWIDQIPQGQIVAIALQDDASLNLSERAQAACQSIGSNQIDRLEFRGSWAIIGVKAGYKGTAIENLNNLGSVSVKAWFPVLESTSVTPSVTRPAKEPISQPIESSSSTSGNNKRVILIGCLLVLILIVIIVAILIH